MKSAWVDFRCSKSAVQAVAVFGGSGTGWQLQAVQPGSSSGGSAVGQVPLTPPFSVSPDYSGCSGCGADSFVRCGACGRLACWRSTTRLFHCPWCEQSGEVQGSIESIGALDAT